MLTAGHCVNSRVRQPRTVKLGRVNLDATDDSSDTNVAQDIPIKVWSNIALKIKTDTSFVMKWKFQKVYLYPTYSARKKYNDIALLELEHGVDYKKSVKPGKNNRFEEVFLLQIRWLFAACLSTKKEPFNKAQILLVTGWGLVSVRKIYETSLWE